MTLRGKERIEVAAIREAKAFGFGKSSRVIALCPCTDCRDARRFVKGSSEAFVPAAPGRTEPFSHEDPRSIAELKPHEPLPGDRHQRVYDDDIIAVQHWDSPVYMHPCA